MIRVFGQITDASGKGVAGAMIELRALKSSTEVLYGSVLTYKCDASGRYEFPLAIGAYDAYAQNDICGDMDYIGTAVVTADTDDGDLHHILVDGGINITPPMLDAAMEFALRAEKAATSAKSDRIQTGKDVIVTDQNKHVAETKAQESATSADEAKAARDSIVQDANEVRHNTQQVAANAASVASNTTLVQRKAEQVAQNTQTVSTKALQVSEHTQSVAANTQVVSLMRDEVVAKTSMAQAAADTATQKAASAAEHDAAAAEYARQAQEAAQATAGALIDGGAADLSTGVYPQPVQVSGTARPTFWKVTKGGTVGGVDYGVGDTLIYTVAGSGSYYKIDNTESVTSVQGDKGAVILTPEKIGADAAGTAQALVNNLKNDPNPFPQYSDFRCGEERDFATRKQLAKRASEYHPMDGQLVPRATDQGLLAAILAGEVPSCSEADWLANPANRGCYTLGDGATTIRIADLNGKSAGSLGAPVIRGDGLNADIAGKIQGDAIRNFTAAFDGIGAVEGLNYAIMIRNATGAARLKGTSGRNIGTASGSQNQPGFPNQVEIDASLQVPTGPENRMVNTAKVRAVKR